MSSKRAWSFPMTSEKCANKKSSGYVISILKQRDNLSLEVIDTHLRKLQKDLLELACKENIDHLYTDHPPGTKQMS